MPRRFRASPHCGPAEQIINIICEPRARSDVPQRTTVLQSCCIPSLDSRRVARPPPTPAHQTAIGPAPCAHAPLPSPVVQLHARGSHSSSDMDAVPTEARRGSSPGIQPESGPRARAGPGTGPLTVLTLGDLVAWRVIRRLHCRDRHTASNAAARARVSGRAPEGCVAVASQACSLEPLASCQWPGPLILGHGRQPECGRATEPDSECGLCRHYVPRIRLGWWIPSRSSEPFKFSLRRPF